MSQIYPNFVINSIMKHSLRQKYLSLPRINRYITATGGDKVRAKRLYNANIRIAQAFHPILSQFEVILRNSLNNKLSAYFTDTDWIINQKAGFMSNNSLSTSRYFLRRSIQKTETNLNNRGIPLTSGKIISNQTFGFWIALYLSHHYMLIGGEPLKVFANKPPIEDRASIYSKLDDIRKFRNRINHCEPICFNGNTINCNRVISVKQTVYNLVDWIEPELIPFFESIDNIDNKINNTMAI